MSEGDKVAELTEALQQDPASKWITHYWTTYNNQRQEKLEDWEELRKYLFATDTRTTSNRSLPWKNSTTLPKLAQIRDNLHANYMAALFPSDKWLKWEGFSREDSSKQKASAITAYMDNKAREGRLKTTVSRLILDYIDYGNVFVTTTFENRYIDKDGERIQDFIGPKAVRVSPEDIVFNPLADSFDDSFKIIRSVKTTGELKKLAKTYPEHAFWEDVLKRREEIRKILSGYSTDDFNKAEQYSVDGFGNLMEYYMSDYVEILEFYGDYHDHETGELHENQMITIVDRATVARQVPIPTYSGRAPIRHVGWRERPGNLWAMGPLDNLVGMQYRIDHLENLKADAMDLIVHPPLKVIGDVDPFEWAPEAQVHLDGEGDVQEISKSLNGVVAAQNEIELLEGKMELYAGAPREAAGIRTPGEKTAFEVQALENAAGRIFQSKIVNFETELMEPMLNDMLEAAHRNFADHEIIREIDGDLGVVSFRKITKEDITAKGILRPVGARNFAQKAQELQNIVGVFNSQLGQLVLPHTSGKALTRYLDDVLDIRGYQIFRPNVRVQEMSETRGLADQAESDSAVNMQTGMDIPEESVGI